MRRALLVLATTVLYVGSCANATVLRPSLPLPALEPTIGVDDSAVCRGLAERFLGLPAVTEERPAAAPVSPPVVGRWWIRSCSATRSGDELRIALKGPGWYWVDQRESGVVIQQQVPFQLQLEVDGTLNGSVDGGVFSLRFTPTRAARVRVSAPSALDVRSEGAFGWLLTHLPLSSPGSTAAERFTAVMTGAVQHALASGATVTYDLGSGQADAALGQLEPGALPERPFNDTAAWIVNERLLLPPAATQVVGPIEPGRLDLDLVVERGPGVSYRSICAEQLPESYGAIATGKLLGVPSAAWRAGGTSGGVGRRSSSIVVEGCRHYLVLTTSGNAPTLAALRLRQ